MRSPSMPTLSTKSFPGYPPVDLHSKVKAETSRRSKTNTMNSVVRAFSSSRALNQVLGMREPEPFPTPPEMPHDLKQQFEAGLQHYERLYAAGFFASNEVEVQAIRPLQKSKPELADILEEKESPVRASPARSASSGIASGLKISVPEWTSSKQAVAVAQRYTFLDSDSDPANDTASEHTNYELGVEDYSSWEYDSSTTLAVSEQSRPGSSVSRRELSSAPASSFPPRTSSLLPNDLSNGGQDTSGLPYRLPNKKALRLGLLPQPAHPDVTTSTLCSDNIALNINSNPASVPVPQITVQAPSPKKGSTSRKRAPSSSDQSDFNPPVSQRARRDDTVGLPSLPSDAEASWKFKFPGNTHALLTILLTWSHTMWSLHNRLPDPKLFAIHPAFPYSVSPPLAIRLLSVSFYDTSIEPHQEVRFLGPGDVAEMSYHEVDVFSTTGSQQGNQEEPQPSFPIGTIKQTLGLASLRNTVPTRYTSPTQRAKTGSGRWCYILLKSHQPPNKATPPHVILAWHASATTATTNCLHTIYPAAAPPIPPPPPQSKLKRFSSLQNLGTALRTPARFNFHSTLRSASSSSELAAVDASAEVQSRGGVTLLRTVLKLERAGGVPLIEGFRVDVKAFRRWLDACGKGKGKVIMWRERDGG